MVSNVQSIPISLHLNDTIIHLRMAFKAHAIFIIVHTVKPADDNRGICAYPEIFLSREPGQNGRLSRPGIQDGPGIFPEPIPSLFFLKAAMVSLIRRPSQSSSNAEGNTNFTWFETSQSSHDPRSATRLKRGVRAGEGDRCNDSRQAEARAPGRRSIVSSTVSPVPDHENPAVPTPAARRVGPPGFPARR